MERCATTTPNTSTVDEVRHHQQRHHTDSYHRLSLHEAITQLDLLQHNNRLAADGSAPTTKTTPPAADEAEDVTTVVQRCDSSHSLSQSDADASRRVNNHRTPSPLPPWRPPQTADAPTPQANMLLSLGVKLRSIVGHGGGGRRQHRRQTSVSFSPTSPANFLLPSSSSGGSGDGCGRHGRDYRAASFSNNPPPLTAAALSIGEPGLDLLRKRSASISKTSTAVVMDVGALTFFRGSKRADASRSWSPNFSTILRTDALEERRGSGASTASDVSEAAEMETHETHHSLLGRLSISEGSASKTAGCASASASSCNLPLSDGRQSKPPVLKSGGGTFRYGVSAVVTTRGDSLPSSMAAGEFHSLTN